jgi:hypothetical protein
MELNRSLGIFRNCQKVAASNFDPKGVNKGVKIGLGIKDPPHVTFHQTVVRIFQLK